MLSLCSGFRVEGDHKNALGTAGGAEPPLTPTVMAFTPDYNNVNKIFGSRIGLTSFNILMTLLVMPGTSL
jgi:hypothetical protein